MNSMAGAVRADDPAAHAVAPDGTSKRNSSHTRVEGRGMTYQEIIMLHPHPSDLDREAVLRCIEACLDCSASCTSCADDSLSEDDSREMTRVIRLALDCSELCDATRRIVIRQTMPDVRVIRATVEACATACIACADECGLHAADHEHCRICAEVCHRCKQACDDLLASVS